MEGEERTRGHVRCLENPSSIDSLVIFFFFFRRRRVRTGRAQWGKNVKYEEPRGFSFARTVKFALQCWYGL